MGFEVLSVMFFDGHEREGVIREGSISCQDGGVWVLAP